MEAPRTGAGAGASRFASRPVAWILAGAGGIIALVGCLLPWLNISLGTFAILITAPKRTLAPNAWGLDGYGKVATIASVLLLASAVVLAISRSNQLRDVFGLLAVVAGAVVTFIALFEVLSKGARVDHLLRQSFSAAAHRPISDVQFDRIKAVLDRLGFSVSVGIGSYLAIAGGVLGLAGGVLAAGARKVRKPAAKLGSGGFLEPNVPPPSPSSPLPDEPPAPASPDEPVPDVGPTHDLPAPGAGSGILDPPAAAAEPEQQPDTGGDEP